MDTLQKQRSIKADEVKSLAMGNYREDTKHIPQEIQLHELLTKIITNDEFNPEQRKQLIELIKHK